LLLREGVVAVMVLRLAEVVRVVSVQVQV
jgi:hypothetical protein